MKRAIKFRAWKIASHMMHENCGFHPSNFQILEGYKADEPGAFIVCPQFNNYDLMQFSGLRDRNGVDIYEGDIVNVVNKGWLNGRKVVVWDETTLSYVLVWSQYYAEFVKTGSSGKTFTKISSGLSCVVLGNIYQHPHLLTGQQATTELK